MCSLSPSAGLGMNAQSGEMFTFAWMRLARTDRACEPAPHTFGSPEPFASAASQSLAQCLGDGAKMLAWRGRSFVPVPMVSVIRFNFGSVRPGEIQGRLGLASRVPSDSQAVPSVTALRSACTWQGSASLRGRKELLCHSRGLKPAENSGSTTPVLLMEGA